MGKVIISGKHVSFKYQKEYVFKDINFDIYNKEFLGIIGPNGGGKTTFIKLLLGILKPMQTPYFSKNHNFLDSKLENIESKSYYFTNLDSINNKDSIESKINFAESSTDSIKQTDSIESTQNTESQNHDSTDSIHNAKNSDKDSKDFIESIQNIESKNYNSANLDSINSKKIQSKEQKSYNFTNLDSKDFTNAKISNKDSIESKINFAESSTDSIKQTDFTESKNYDSTDSIHNTKNSDKDSINSSKNIESKTHNSTNADSKNTKDSINNTTNNSKNIESNPQNTESKTGIFYPHPELFSSPKQIGYVPQNTQINLNFPIMAIEVVEMGFLESKMLGFRVKKKQREIAMQNLEKLGIAHLAFKKIGELSGGERQRVLIARAISGDKKLLILDEPTSNIDAKTQKEIYKILKRINEFHTIISISHDIPITLEYATRILYINKQIHSHEVPKLELNSDGHICEIDIFQDFANVLRR